MKFFTDGTQRLTIDSDGAIQVPTTGALSIGNSVVVTAEPDNMLSVGSKMIAENDVQISKGIILNTDGTQISNPNFTVAAGEFKSVLDYDL